MKSDFGKLSAEGVRSSGPRIWVRHVSDESCQPPRVAFALGRKTANAPARNRLRRQIRAILSDPRVVVAPGLYLIGVNGKLRQQPFGDLKAELEGLLP